jgi:single-strand DNA-binding protein
MGVNKAILLGNLGRDPELRYTPGGAAVANFTLATTERYTDKSGQKQERTEWHNIVVWNKQAELCNQYLKKGRSAYIEGRITTRSWDDRDGNKKYRTEIVATTVQFIGGAPDRGAAASPATATPEAAPFEGTPEMTAEPGPVAQDELPF